MSSNLSGYLEYINKPWGQLFYRIVWEQMDNLSSKKVLDFGSGFGVTANHFAKTNDVTAIEPSTEMLEMRISEYPYKQIIGDIDNVKGLPDNVYDYVICHNVLEYVQEQEEILRELCRVLKPGGSISILKHNHAGRIMQKVVFENNMDEAMSILGGNGLESGNFGKINYYTINNIKQWLSNTIVSIEKVYGVRTFFGLQQNNEIKFDKTWQEKMFAVEMKVSNIDDYKNIAFFNHIILSK